MVSSVLPAYSAETAEPPHSSPLESVQPDSIPSDSIPYRESSPGRHPGHGTTCSSYKHAPPIYEKAPRPSISEGRL